MTGIIGRWLVRRSCFHHNHLTHETWLALNPHGGPLMVCRRCGAGFDEGDCAHHTAASSWIMAHMDKHAKYAEVWQCITCRRTWRQPRKPLWWQE